MRLTVLTVVVALVAGSVLAGCIGDLDAPAETPDPSAYLDGAVFSAADKWSQTLSEGVYEIGAPVEHLIDSEVDGVPLSVGVVLPKGLAEGESVPVILDAGPYYGDGEGPVTAPTENRLSGWLIETFVPHGYAVAMASVRGTGNSGGCMDFMGHKEQQDLDTVITWLGTQDWSNGNIGMSGRSYDGSTPFQAAGFGNPHLKTIVPISGLSSVGDMYFRNGTAEGRTPILGALYWTYGAWEAGAPPFGSDPMPTTNGDETKMACPDIAAHVGEGAIGTLTGGFDPTGYWAARDFKPDLFANYQGSVFIVQGLQDWNVDPHMATDVWRHLDDTKVSGKKLLFGQWQHMYPDRPYEQNPDDCGDLCAYPQSVRWDWSETLLRWFDQELKGLDVNTGPTVESQDDKGNWHAGDAWPPTSTTYTPLYLDGDALSTEEGEHAAAQMNGQPGVGPFADRLSWTSEPFANDTRIAGLPRFHVTVQPTTPGGNLIAALVDIAPNGEEKLVGHAFMDLRYADGGKEMQPVVPGQEIVAKMEMFPLDATIPSEHRVRVDLYRENPVGLFSDPVPDPMTAPLIVHYGEGYTSVVKLPIVTDDTDVGLGWTAVEADGAAWTGAVPDA